MIAVFYIILFTIKDVIFFKVGFSNLLYYIMFYLFSILLGFLNRGALYFRSWYFSLNEKINFFKFNMDWSSVSHSIPIHLIIMMVVGLILFLIPVYYDVPIFFVLTWIGMINFSIPGKAKSNILNKLKKEL